MTKEKVRTYSFQICYSKWITAADAKIRFFRDTGEIFGGVAEGFGDSLDMFGVFGGVFSGES